MSNFGSWTLTRGHITFPGLLLVLIGFLYKTAQNRLKTAQMLLEKPFKNHRKKLAVFERFCKQDLSGLSGFSEKTPKPPKPPKPLTSCWKTAQTAHVLSGFWAWSRPGRVMNEGKYDLRSVLVAAANLKKEFLGRCYRFWYRCGQASAVQCAENKSKDFRGRRKCDRLRGGKFHTSKKSRQLTSLIRCRYYEFEKISGEIWKKFSV